MAGPSSDPAALRPLTAADLPAAQALTAGFGWPHRLEDWAAMQRIGEGIVAESEGALVGTALRWRFGRHRACLGLVAVSPAMQGQGLGRRLMQATLDELQGRSVLLHATEVALPLYRSLGFRDAGVVRQHQGAAFQSGLVALPPGDRLRPLGRSDPPLLAALDRIASGMERDALLAMLLETASAVVLDRAGEPAGFAMLRRFGRGQVIGPVVAADATGAKAMILHFLGSAEGQFIRVDAPEETGLSPWLAELGLADAGPAIRMVRGDPPEPAAGPRVFGLVSQALG